MLYIYYNIETGEVISISLFKQKRQEPFIMIDDCDFIKPKVNLQTLKLHESATNEEIAEISISK